RHGIKLYRDVGAPDGPIIHYLHALMQLFAGMSDHGCRVADIVFHFGGSCVMGAVLAPRFATSRRANVGQRFAWAVVASSMWFSWYLTSGWFNTVQRDAYYALIGYLGLVLVYASADFEGTLGQAVALGGGFLVGTQLFGRPFGIVYVAMAGLGLAAADPGEPFRWERAKATAIGVVASAVAILGTLSIVGSLRGLVFWYFRFPLSAYQFIGRQSFFRLLTEEYAAAASIAIFVLVGVGGAVLVGALPRRTIGFAFTPLLFLAAASWAGKGWPQHVQQVTAGANVVLLVVLSRLWHHRSSLVEWSGPHAGAAVLVLLLAAYRCNALLQESPFARESPVPNDYAGAEAAGRWVRDHTDPTDSLFMFHHDAHVMITAERRPAIPYYVNSVLSIRTWLEHEPGEKPTPSQRASFDKLQDDIANDACHRLLGSPPAAMVLVDRPPKYGPDAITDLGTLCPGFPALTAARYVRNNIAGYPVYLRNDRVR
ncbi:MAG TPA: hypothetical protein VN894_17195, partial [Polyangiaceae bacterium]|nr:hypothetical protein [Polyangiaceae bacterium]